MEDNLTRPPRWAEALLHLFLTPGEAETVFGDLLETYRDGILPERGRFRANLWFVRQVPSYALRTGSLNVRNLISAGLALCAFSIVFSILRYPALLDVAGFPGIFVLVLPFSFFVYAAVRWTHPANADRALALRLGTRWGVAIGALWTLTLYSANLRLLPGFPLGAFAGLACAFVCGAHVAIKTNRLHAGLRVGFWSGLVSGVIVFLTLVALGYIMAFVPGLPGAEIPATKAYTALEYQQVNIEDVLGGASSLFLLIGVVIGPLAGWVGGWAGLLLARTGHIHEV